MATFERLDPDGDLNSGNSVFYITDSAGNQVQLSQLEAEQLLPWLQSFLAPLPSSAQGDQAQGTYQFEPDDTIEHMLYGERKLAQFLREETIDGHRWIYVQSLEDSSLNYRIPFDAVKTVSRVIPGEGTVTHRFGKEEE